MNEAKKTNHDKKFDDVRKKLLERKKELEEEISELSSTKVAGPDQIQDIGDHAQSLFLETLRISLQDTEMQELNMILQAIKMIDNGTYGNCIDCGQVISEKRLSLHQMQQDAWCAKKSWKTVSKNIYNDFCKKYAKHYTTDVCRCSSAGRAIDS